jgi:hypothetical protein
MKAAQAQMDASLEANNQAADQRAKEMEMVPDMGALTSITSTIHKMGMSQA